MAYHNNSNGYTNGSHASALRHFNFQDSSRETSADERSRSRPAATYDPYAYTTSSQSVHGVSRLERNRANRRSRDYAADNISLNNQAWSASRSRSRPGARYGNAGNQIEEILRYIEQHWAFMASEECIPIKVALQLMDPSSLGLQDQMGAFTEAHTQLQNALKVIVNEHHQGFNSSIGTFHKIQTAIQASQARVRTLRGGLVEAKRDLVGGQQKPELKALATSSQAYDAMLQTIATIETLQLVPDRLEAQIREKRYLGAVENLQEALGMLRKPELEDIGALSELRVHLSNQEQILTDLLVEELHNHLYLKSPYCEERWKGYMSRSVPASKVAGEAPAPVLDDDRVIYTFLSNYDGSSPMEEDASRNPEADTFYYIQLLIESLDRMDKLDLAADKIEERLPVELFKVLERTLVEVEQRHPQSMMKSGQRRQQLASSNVLGAGPDAEQRATLEDLLAMLYAKFEAIAEGHRVLYDVTYAILKRENVPSSEASTLNRSFRELWKLLQSEIRSLLHDHLATNGHVGTKSRQQKDASADIFKPHPRDRGRRLFKLNDTLKPGKDGKANTDLVGEREDLEFILKASVPGLVDSTSNSSHIDSFSSNSDDAVVGADRSATGHKLLLPPSIFNMGTLLPPSIAFLTTLKPLVPANSGSGVVPTTLTAFLDDFLINVFYPQLEETLIELCSHCLESADTVQIDPAWKDVASRPIFRGVREFYGVLEDVCRLLGRLPHEVSFAQLVVAQMRGVYERCYGWSKNLLQRVGGGEAGSDEVRMRLAAELATEGDINEVVIEVLKTVGQGENGGAEGKEAVVLAEKESELLLRLVKTQGLEEPDLITDRKALQALCTLQVSMRWLAEKCKALRFISPFAVDTANTQLGQSRRWTSGTVPTLSSMSTPTTQLPTTPYLPLDESTAHGFDAVTTSFTELSTLILRTLHIDMRLHLLHGILTALSTSYALSQPYNDPDPAILTLSPSLSSYDQTLSTNLLDHHHAFLTTNLHIPATNALISFVSFIPDLDIHGEARMSLNILVLQQTLKTLSTPPSAASLTKAARFYELGARGPETVVKDGAKAPEAFKVEDLRALVRLCWREERDGSKEEVETVVGKLGGFPERKSSLKGRSGGRGRGRGGRSTPGTPAE